MNCPICNTYVAKFDSYSFIPFYEKKVCPKCGQEFQRDPKTAAILLIPFFILIILLKYYTQLLFYQRLLIVFIAVFLISRFISFKPKSKADIERQQKQHRYLRRFAFLCILSVIIFFVLFFTIVYVYFVE